MQHTFDRLDKGAAKGYGVNWKIADTEQDRVMVNHRILEMKQNLYKFSAAKNVAMNEDINRMLYDGNRLKPYEEFKRDLEKLGSQYANRYLQAEYNTALQSGRNAKAWEAFEHNKERFPNLEYRTQGDDRVRDEHEALNGFTAAIDDPVWNSIAPPSGWNCRCYLVQTAGPVSKETPDWKKSVAPEFRHNPGRGGQVFKEDSDTGHRYFALAKNNPEWPKRFELSKLEAGHERITTPKGNKVEVSIYHDANEPRNLDVAIQIADQINAKIKINAHLDGSIILNHPNPEYTINGKTADRKSPEGKKLRHLFKRANDKQNCEIIVFDMEKYPFSYNTLLSKIKESLLYENYPKIKEVIIIDKEHKVTHYLREMLQNNKE